MLFERQILSVDFLKNSMWPLLERHYKEISAFQDIPLEPDFEKYVAMERAGTLRCFVARGFNEQNELCLLGYSVYFVNINIHYSSSKQAVQDVLYMEQSKRGLGAGKGLIAYCDEELRKEGVQVVYHHVKTKFNFGPLLESLGYKHIENIYGRRLDGK